MAQTRAIAPKQVMVINVAVLFLLSRVLLRFAKKSDDLLGELSAVARTSDSLMMQTSNHLDLLYGLPFTIGSDHAEGLALFP